MPVSQLACENAESRWPLLNKRSLEACPPELQHRLAYVNHLRAHWRPEADTKLIVPSSWMEFIAPTHRKCGMECTRDRGCPFHRVRFESKSETRFGTSDERLTRDVASQLFTDLGEREHLNLRSFVTRAFGGIPHFKLRSDWAATSESVSNSTTGLVIRPLDFFALVRSQDGDDAEDTPQNGRTPGCLLLGIRERTQSRQSLLSKTLSLTPILKDLADHARFHLSLLTTLIKRGITLASKESFPEWLVLFSLVYDSEHLRIVVHLPVPSCKEQKTVDCVSYIVDEFSLRSSVTPTARCDLILERLRILLALSTLRRHVFQLSRSLFNVVGPCGAGDGGHSHSDHCHAEERCVSPCSTGDCSSDYSTCPSHTLMDNPECAVERCSRYVPSCKSSISSFCSTCSSLSGSLGTSNSVCSERSRCTDSERSNYMYMEPSTMSGSRGGGKSTSPKKLTEIRRREIITWAREVIPTEHPVKDTYQMIIRHDSHPRRPRHVELKLNTRR